MSDKIEGIDSIGSKKEAREAGGAAMAGGLYGAQGPQGAQAPQEMGKAQEPTAVKGIKDKVEISESEEAGGANIQALKGNLVGQGQGFEQGVQPSFAMNSIQGIQSGMEPGLQKGGVFKSPYGEG
jgi:hypothetical protein